MYDRRNKWRNLKKYAYEHVCYLFIEKQEIISRIIHVPQRWKKNIVERMQLLMTELETWNT